MTKDAQEALLSMLAQLHTSSVRELLAKIESKEATAADFTAAIKLLQHNNIGIGKLQPGSPEDKLGKAVVANLPFQDGDGSEDYHEQRKH